MDSYLIKIYLLKRTIQRVRKQNLQLPNDPTDLKFIIPDEMTKTIDGNIFLQYNSDINTEQILIFFNNTFIVSYATIRLLVL